MKIRERASIVLAFPSLFARQHRQQTQEVCRTQHPKYGDLAWHIYLWGGPAGVPARALAKKEGSRPCSAVAQSGSQSAEVRTIPALGVSAWHRKSRGTVPRHETRSARRGSSFVSPCVPSTRARHPGRAVSGHWTPRAARAGTVATSLGCHAMGGDVRHTRRHAAHETQGRECRAQK